MKRKTGTQISIGIANRSIAEYVPIKDDMPIEICPLVSSIMYTKKYWYNVSICT